MNKYEIIILVIWSTLFVLGLSSFLALYFANKKSVKEKKNGKHTTKKK